MAHQKHPKLNKSHQKQWHRHEWAIYGTVCTDIAEIAEAIADALQPIKVGYLDESHDKDSSSSLALQITQSGSLPQVSQNQELSFQDIQRTVRDIDILLINGNHHKASRQIIFQDERKRESLGKKLDRLSKVDIVLESKEGSPFGFLDPIIERDQPDKIGYDVEQLASVLLGKWKAEQPQVKGLVLAGGKSSRMGEDKGLINYHGQSQRDYVANLFVEMGLEPHLSLASDQDSNDGETTMIHDTFLGLGPLSGILSAFMIDPDSAWMTVACDLPYLSEETMTQLLEARDHSKVATCFHNPETDFPEPLITIWEPRAYQRMLMFLAQGYACPRKVLINSDVKQISMQQGVEMTNVNTQEEREKFYRSKSSKG